MRHPRQYRPTASHQQREDNQRRPPAPAVGDVGDNESAERTSCQPQRHRQPHGRRVESQRDQMQGQDHP
jgi:hypothetical protein